MVGGFHTTQYDLNNGQPIYPFQIYVFPYYIVRFKQHSLALSHLRPVRSFHTTQYDLNVLLLPSLALPLARFHTTQYDLNIYICFIDYRFQGWFPYYIVRFKLFVLIVLFPYPSKFPYYIVRFKLTMLPPFVLLPLCFHTTQYDLNFGGGAISICLSNVSILHSTI